MQDNFLSGRESASINAMLAANGWNLKKMMKDLAKKSAKTLFVLLQILFVVPLGGEEGVPISDMLDNRFINPSALSRALIQTNSVPSTRSESDIIQYIIDNNIQVYWPYSDGYVNSKMIIE